MSAVGAMEPAGISKDRTRSRGARGAQLSKSTKAGAAGSVLIRGARKHEPAPKPGAQTTDPDGTVHAEIACHWEPDPPPPDDLCSNGSLAYFTFCTPDARKTWMTTANAMNDPRTYLAWYGASAFTGSLLVGSGAIGGGGFTTLAGEDGLGLVSNQTINRMIGATQRELLKDFFKSGELPKGLSRQTLQLYKTIAERAIEAGKDQLGVQAQRIQLINTALRAMGAVQ